MAAKVVVVEAAAGYGKTVLGAELADAWQSVAIEVVLHEGGASAQLFAARLRAAVSYAGFREAAGTMPGAGEDAAGAVDALADALAGERCAFLVDDAHHALLLAPEVRVDLRLFEAEGRKALALGPAEPALAVATARSAITRYRGEVLPGDLYEQWAEHPREHARRTMLALLDLCADVASDRGDLDEARRVTELAIDLAPYDDARYLRAATALLERGRRGAALACASGGWVMC